MTKYLRHVFSRYNSVIQGLSQIHSHLAGLGSAVIDVFAYLPDLSTYIACWSSLTSRMTNRIFIDAKEDAFVTVRTQNTPYISYRSALDPTTNSNDISLLLVDPILNAVALIPIESSDGSHIGMIRILGQRSRIEACKIFGSNRSLLLNSKADAPSIEPDLYPHILGRWAGTVYEFSSSQREPFLNILLRAFSSFTTRSIDTYWQVVFDKNRVAFGLACSEAATSILSDLSDTLLDPHYMFSIVARYGNAEILQNFPEDLENTRTPNLRDWKPDVYYRRLKASLANSDLSYYCIPLKVDDCVIGVFSMMTPREPEHFQSAARFARSCLSEMGRTIDKNSLSRAATSLKNSAYLEHHEAMQSDPVVVGRQLIEEIAQLILPASSIQVGALTYTPNGIAPDLPRDFPKCAISHIKRHMWDILKTKEIRLITTNEPTNMTSNAILAVPITAGKPYLLYLYGPIEVISGRSLKAILEEMQAVLYLSFITASKYLASDDIINEVRSSLNIWAHVHDLKNDVVHFGKRFTDLSQYARGANITDLRNEVLTITDNFESIVDAWKAECDELLEKSFTRHMEEISLIECINMAFQSASSRFPELMMQVRFITRQTSDIRIISYGKELQVIFQEIFRNAFKHFQRTHPGKIEVAINREKEGLPVSIIIGDDVHEVRAYEAIYDSLKAESKSALGRIKKTIVRLLEGDIWVQKSNKGDNANALLAIRLPLEIKPH